MHEFLKTWSIFSLDDPPYFLDGDDVLLGTVIRQKHVMDSLHWRAFVKSESLIVPAPGLHLGLIPKPFVGDPRTASVVLLMLNPDFRPVDYYAEATAEDYRKVLTNSLKLTGRPGRRKSTFLDSRFAWHGAFGHWT